MALSACVITSERPIRLAQRPQRAARHKRRRAGATMRVGFVSAALLAAVLAYVGMTADLTAQTYRLSSDQARHAELVQSTDGLTQRLAQLQSLSRLEQAAAALHMTEPQRVVVIAVPTVAQAKAPMTFAARLSNLAKWLKRE